MVVDSAVRQHFLPFTTVPTTHQGRGGRGRRRWLEVLVDFPPVLGEIARDHVEAELGQYGTGRLPVQQEGERRPHQCLRRGRLQAELGFQLARHGHDVARFGLAVPDSYSEVPVGLAGHKDSRQRWHSAHGSGARPASDLWPIEITPWKRSNCGLIPPGDA